MEVLLADNSLTRFLLAPLTALGILALGLLSKKFFRSRTPMAAGEVSWRILYLLFAKIHVLFILVLAVQCGSLWLTLPADWEKYLCWATGIIVALQIGLWGSLLVNLYLRRYREIHLASHAENVTTFSFIGFLIKLVLYTILLLLVFQNLGINVTALLTGLGVGGIAVALAAQNTLGDFLGSLSIILDKPFVLGDYIVVDQYEGTVENIGLKTTRIRSLSGEQIIFSNADLLKSRIRNYQLLNERRVSFKLRIDYSSPLSSLREIPRQVKSIVAAQEKCRFDRAHLQELGDAGYIFEIVYFVADPDYGLFMNRQQEIYLRILDLLASAGLRLGLPSSRIRVEADSGAVSQSA